MDLTWKKIKEEKYRAGYRKLNKKTFVLPSGHQYEYDTADSSGAVCVLALTPTNKVILEKVFRPGPEKIVMEMPGGGLKEGENPKDAIERELLEETGYKGEIEFVGTALDDAYSSMIRHCFVAKNCRKVQEPSSDEEDEQFLEIVEMTLEEFRDHLRSGELTDVEVGYLALDHLGLL